MKKIFLLCLIVFAFYSSHAQALLKKSDQIKPKPKLVIGIVVDQMRYDYIYKFWNQFGDGGFRRLVNEGFSCKNTNYNYVPTYTGPGHASIYTGTTPSVHGIIANNWYDRKAKQSIYCSFDVNEVTLGSLTNAGRMSPRNMLTTSVGDELRLSNNKKSKVIGIALKDRGAILPAGHAANAAYWYDGSNGAWISSTYYMKELPQWVIEFNKKELAKKYLSQSWTTLLPIEQYVESTDDDKLYEQSMAEGAKPVFPYNIPELTKKEGLNLIRNTPFGNSFTKDFALETIKQENLGKGSYTDFLAISFSSTDYIGHQFGPHSVEVEDCYLRLDRDIEEMLNFLDTWIGKNNALVFLTADHGAVDAPGYLAENRVPSGVLEEKAIIDSVRKFISKKFVDTSLFMGFSNLQVFLNRHLMIEKKMNPVEIENTIAEYLLTIKGVGDVLTESLLNHCSFNDVPRKNIQNGYHRQRSGDVMMVTLPGWVEDYQKGTTHGSPYTYDSHVPLIFYGCNINPGSSTEYVEITDIAPTISMMLNIQYPNGCTGKPIQSVLK